ncbi:DUF4224 domain-containing protein [Thiocystis violacea]|uniref:DUF4224 domain-containing protein n=1 Tax=Thiocystis violacea TaxID=13725 RepID=UPI001908B608|nr:hypothetical protein [Thiocystis violacea]
MSHPSAFGPEDLATLTGYKQQADIERWCQRQGVRYFRGKAGIWTTLEAVNAALGLRPDRSEPPPQRLEF